MLENLLMKHFPTGGNTLDYEKIVALPDKDFAELYLELMTEYRDKNGWWSGDKIPMCNECNTEISGPAQLRRYYGRSLHPECFKQVFEREGHKEGIMKQYWERVTNLVLDA